MILSNCTKPRTGQPGCIWRKYLFLLVKMLRFYRNFPIEKDGFCTISRNSFIKGHASQAQWHQPVRTLKRTGSFLSKKRKIHPWLIFLFFEFEVLYYSHHPCIVTYPLVLKHFCIGGLRLPSIRNFAVGMELIHLPHRL